MKCPYMKKVVHKCYDFSINSIIHSEDIPEFCDCIKTECPFYYTTEYRPTKYILRIKEKCRKVENELL